MTLYVMLFGVVETEDVASADCLPTGMTQVRFCYWGLCYWGLWDQW